MRETRARSRLVAPSRILVTGGELVTATTWHRYY
jgi:hypothetical protein